MKEKELLGKALSDSGGISLIEHTKAVVNVANSLVDVLVSPNCVERIRKQALQAAALHDIGKCLRVTQDYFKKPSSKKNFDEDASIDTSEKVSVDACPPKHNVVSWSYASTFCKLDKIALMAIIHHHIIPEKSAEFSSTFLLADEYSDDIKTMHSFFSEISGYVNELCSENILKRSRIINRDYKLASDVPPFMMISEDRSRSSFNDAADAILVRAILIYADRIVSGHPEFSLLASENRPSIINELVPNFSVDYPDFDIRKCEAYDSSRLVTQLTAINEALNSEAPASILAANAGFGKTLAGLLYILELKKRAFWVAPQNNIAREAYNSITNELATMGLSDKISVALLLSGEYEYGSSDANIIITNIDNFFNPAIRNSDAINYISETAATVVFDEYHKFVTNDSMFAMFIQLMYTRFHHVKTNTLLMSATPMNFEQFFWRDCKTEHTVHTVHPDLFNCDMKMQISVKEIKTYNDINPQKDAFVILPTIDEVQDAYVAFKEANPGIDVSIIHARYTDEHRKELEKMIHETHGKHSNILMRQVVFGSSLITTGLDISARSIYDFLLNPESTLQAGCGRGGRYLKEYNLVEYVYCKAKRSVGAQSIINDTYDAKLLRKWEKIIEELDGKIITKKELYSIYYKFYEDNKEEVKKMHNRFLRASNKELCSLRPYAVKFKSPNRDIMSSRVSWRGPGNSIYAIARRKGETKPTAIVKITTRSVEWLDCEWTASAQKARYDFICNCGERGEKFKTKFEHSDTPVTKETYFSYGRCKETPFYLHTAYYDDELGLVL